MLMSSRTTVISRAVRGEIEAGLFPGAVIMLGRPGEVLYHEAFGRARVRPVCVPMQRDTVFDLASVTKVAATATAAAIAIEDGLLDFASRVSTYLPRFSAPGTDAVTVGQLGTHTGGLTNIKFPDLTGEAMLDALEAAPLAWPPESAYEYTCRAFILLGLVVEAATDRSLAEFCDERIYRPLGMADTRFGPIESTPRLAGNEREGGQISDEQAQTAGRPIGNAGLFSTAPDLARFAEMMLGRGTRDGVTIISESMHKQITARMSPRHLPARGFGWDLRPPLEAPARPHLLSDVAYGHTGWTGQSLWIDPLANLYLIILTNRTHPSRRDDHETAAVARARIGDTVLESLPV